MTKLEHGGIEPSSKVGRGMGSRWHHHTKIQKNFKNLFL